jgi:hypothetical protein
MDKLLKYEENIKIWRNLNNIKSLVDDWQKIISLTFFQKNILILNY